MLVDRYDMAKGDILRIGVDRGVERGVEFADNNPLGRIN